MPPLALSACSSSRNCSGSGILGPSTSYSCRSFISRPRTVPDTIAASMWTPGLSLSCSSSCLQLLSSLSLNRRASPSQESLYLSELGIRTHGRCGHSTMRPPSGSSRIAGFHCSRGTSTALRAAALG